MSIKHNKWQDGLTVIELLIILAAIAIVVMISVPGSTVVLEHFRLKAASSDLVGSLNLAKEEAMLRNSTVKVCPSSNGRFCRTDGNWNHGWLVYSDGNGDGTVQEIEFIEAFDAPSQKVQIVATGAVENIASFTLSGLVPANETQEGEFHVCHAGLDSRAKVVSIDSDGWVNVSRTESGLGACSRI
jgi:type IV fimbrial biogenesis protein FimT